jgi:hypothetical protein
MSVVTRLIPVMLLVPVLAGANCAAEQPPVKTAPSPAAPPEKKALAVAPKPHLPEPLKENFCILCHGESDLWEGERRRFYIAEKDLAADIHWQKGLRCHDCHGGDPATTKYDQAHSAGANFHVLKSHKDIPDFCGRCHSDIEYMRHYQPSPRTDQAAAYWTSGHGKRLKETGDPEVAVCTSCHGGKHHIQPVHDLDSPVYPTRIGKTCATCHSDAKKMAGREFHGRPIGHDQYSEWEHSVHGKALLEKGDLSAPTCNRCHGNHGAVPPEVDSVANACGTCHGKVAKLFANTRMRHQFEKVGLPGCATCHSNHLIRTPSDEMLGMGEKSTCARCHAHGQFGATVAGADIARTLRGQLDELNQLISEAEAKTSEADRLGMEVSGPLFDLRKAFNARVNARTLIHTFSPEPVNQALAEGRQTALDVERRAEAALQEYTARRVWLAGSLVPLAIVVLLLLVYIRRLPIPPVEQVDSPA